MKFRDNVNFIDNQNGRKYSFGFIKFIGEFTIIDLSIVIFSLLITIPFWFFPLVNKESLFLISLIIYMFTFFLIKEIRGSKLYERIWNTIKFQIIGSKKVVIEELALDNENIYEVMDGINIFNLSKNEEEIINNNLNMFFSEFKGDIKIFKLNSTLRTEEVKSNLMDKFSLNDDNKNKQEIILSYLENIESFRKSSMPNIYIKLIGADENEIRRGINSFESIFSIRKVEEEEWKAIKLSNFNLKEEYKEKRNRMESKTDEKAIGSISFGRNVKSNFLEELIYNENMAFVLELKNPNFKESEKIKKSIKSWSKYMADEDIDEIKGKDFIDTKNKRQAKQAKDEVMTELILGKDELKLMNGYFIFSKNKSSEQSFKKQLRSLDWKLNKMYNFELNVWDGRQQEALREVFLDKINNKRWYPINVSTFTNAIPFQNNSFLDLNGGYIGTNGGIFPFVFNAWKSGTSGRHMGILAKTGAGKTILMKKLITSDGVMQDSIQYIIDPKNDGFGAVIEKLNGQSINVEKQKINPLKIYLNKDMEVDELWSLIEEKAIEIQEFLKILFDNDSNVYGLADEIKKFYISKIKELRKGKEFIFDDILTYLIKKQAKSKFDDFEVYSKFLEKLITGTYSRFNNKNEVEITNDKSIVFEVHEVFENPSLNISNATMFIIMNMIINQVYHRNNKSKALSLWIDEAGDFFKSTFLVKKIEKLMVKSRSFNTKICWATQNPSDLIGDNNKALASIFANTEHLFVGQLKDGQVGVVNDMFKLAETDSFTEIERDWIKDSSMEMNKGKFLYINSNKRNLIQVDYLNDFILRDWIEEWKDKEGRE